MHKYIIGISLVAIIAVLLVGCGDHTGDHAEHAGHDHGSGAAAADHLSNRTPIPPIVRRNLGLTFATAHYRAVTSTVTIPG